MSEASDQFEILVSRIHGLLEGGDAEVTWDERIPDPDNPSQERQIDVLVKKDGLVNHIECRLHQNPQDVTWIEELIGRRTSLGANSVIAVSASGFTTGAIRKANSYGIILRDVNELTDEEIQSWSRSVKVSVFYYRYENLRLSFFFDPGDIEELDYDVIQRELQEYVGFRSLFTAQIDAIDDKQLIVEENRNKRVSFKVRFALEGFQLCGYEVKEVEADGVAFLEEIELIVPQVLAYGEPGIESEDRNVYIQNYNLGETKVVHHDGHISISLDISKLEVPPYWQFRYLQVSSEHENYTDLLEIIHPEKIVMNVDKINLDICSVSA